MGGFEFQPHQRLGVWRVSSRLPWQQGNRGLRVAGGGCGGVDAVFIWGSIVITLTEPKSESAGILTSLSATHQRGNSRAIGEVSLMRVSAN